MKKLFLILPAAVLAAIGLTVSAQDGGTPPAPGTPPGPGGPPPGGGEGRGPMRPMVMPIVAALDLDKNGEISADEITKASESLKTLDKNGDGKLTPDEIRPPRMGPPPGQPGQPGGDGPRRPRPPGQGGEGGPPPGGPRRPQGPPPPQQ